MHMKTLVSKLSQVHQQSLQLTCTSSFSQIIMAREANNETVLLLDTLFRPDGGMGNIS